MDIINFIPHVLFVWGHHIKGTYNLSLEFMLGLCHHTHSQTLSITANFLE